MYKLCKTEQSARRQREFEDKLLEMMLHKQYEDITVSDLCDSLGAPRKSFYRYFSGKDGALHAMLDHHLLEYENRTDDGINVWKMGITIDLHWFFTFWIRKKPLLDALNRSGLSGILVERAIRNSRQAQVFENTPYSRDYIEQVTAFAVSGLMSLVLIWHHDGYRQSPEEMAEMTCRMLGEPLAPELAR